MNTITKEDKKEMKQANRSFNDMIRRMRRKGALISVTNYSTDMKQNVNLFSGPRDEDEEDFPADEY